VNGVLRHLRTCQALGVLDVASTGDKSGVLDNLRTVRTDLEKRRD
jgi:hypothetical protein